jgi:signal transduction histidine kinase
MASNSLELTRLLEPVPRTGIGTTRRTARRASVTAAGQIKHLMRLVDDLLEVSRITRGLERPISIDRS